MNRPYRGELWWAQLTDEPRGSEPAGRRPVIVLQADWVNAAKFQTVTVIPVTTTTKLARIPHNVLLEPEDSGLPRRCVAQVYQVVTIDRDWLEEHVGALPAAVMREIEAGVRSVLGL